MLQASDEKKQPLDVITDCHCRFHHVGDVTCKCRLSVKSLEAAKIFQLMLRKIMLLREGFVNKCISGGTTIDQDKS